MIFFFFCPLGVKREAGPSIRGAEELSTVNIRSFFWLDLGLVSGDGWRGRWRRGINSYFEDTIFEQSQRHDNIPGFCREHIVKL